MTDHERFKHLAKCLEVAVGTERRTTLIAAMEHLIGKNQNDDTADGTFSPEQWFLARDMTKAARAFNEYFDKLKTL